MRSWIILAVLAVAITVAMAAGPQQEQMKDEVEGHHGPSPAHKDKLRRAQAHFIDRAKQIKNDDSLSEEEKQKELHTLREHAMMYMGPHALLPHALMQKSPIPAVEEKRIQLVKAVESIAVSDLDFEEKKRELEAVRDHFKAEVNEIHSKLTDHDKRKVRSAIKQKSESDAYKQMIKNGIRGAMEAEPRNRAFNEAIFNGMRKLTAGLKNKEMGEYRKEMNERRMASAGKSGMKRRAARESRSRPDLF